MCVCVCVCVCVGFVIASNRGCKCDTLRPGTFLKTGTVPPPWGVSAIDCKSNVEYVHKWRKFVCTRNVPQLSVNCHTRTQSVPYCMLYMIVFPSPIACSKTDCIHCVSYHPRLGGITSTCMCVCVCTHWQKKKKTTFKLHSYVITG